MGDDAWEDNNAWEDDGARGDGAHGDGCWGGCFTCTTVGKFC